MCLGSWFFFLLSFFTTPEPKMCLRLWFFPLYFFHHLFFSYSSTPRARDTSLKSFFFFHLVYYSRCILGIFFLFFFFPCSSTPRAQDASLKPFFNFLLSVMTQDASQMHLGYLLFLPGLKTCLKPWFSFFFPPFTTTRAQDMHLKPF